jgi:predicted enzyme related to lactoylglutathione lyase
MLNVFETPATGGTQSTVATLCVDNIDSTATELAEAGGEFVHYNEFDQDEHVNGPRAGGGRIAWLADPDGNTIAIDADE